jgi:hypothetical protein
VDEGHDFHINLAVSIDDLKTTEGIKK